MPASIIKLAERIGDREIERAFERAFAQRIGGEREGGDAHQLEPDEQIEQIVGQAEADDRREEQQHENLKVRVHVVEISPGEDEGGGEQ